MKNEKTIHTDDVYLLAILENDSSTIRTIYEKFQPSIIKYITSNNGSPQEAEDIFADGLVVIYRKLMKGNFELRVKFHTYLYSVCQRLWWNKLRRKKFKSGVTLDDDRILSITDDAQVAIEKTERYSLYQDKFLLLGEACQKILSLTLREGKKMVEVAEIMNISAGFARKKKHICKGRLIALIQKDTRFNELKQ